MRPHPAPIGDAPTVPPSPVGVAWPRAYALRLAQAAWVAIALLTLVIYAIGVAVFFEAVGAVCSASPCLDQQLSPADFQLLADVGISIELYAAAVTALAVAPAAVWFAIAALIFLRKAANPPALIAAFFLVTFPSDIADVLKTALPAWTPAVNVMGFLGIVMLTLFTYLFPDGRFVPRWSWLLAIVWIMVSRAPGYFLAPGSSLDSDTSGPPA